MKHVTIHLPDILLSVNALWGKYIKFTAFFLIYFFMVGQWSRNTALQYNETFS